jgi:hypothetical protein
MIFFFGGVGVKYPSSLGRVSGFSGFDFSVSGILSSPTATPSNVCLDLGQVCKRERPVVRSVKIRPVD